MLSRYLPLLLLSVVPSFNAFGQAVTDAVVLGSVYDVSHGTVPGATVTLKHAATGTVTRVETDANGTYRTPPVRIGEYTLEVQAPGFKTYSESHLVLDIGDTRELDPVLQIGEISQTVEVASAAPLLQTSDSTVGTVVTNKQIEQLPLNGRDYLQLAALSSGTVPAVNNGVGISIGGQAGSQAAFLLDGLDNNNQQISTGHSNQKEIIKPSVDAIQEFKVVTNSYSAEYGRSSSGIVSVSLKSGTNDFHGVAYEFLRNDALDAKNFFAVTKSPYKRNQYGAAIGGPVIHNKTFFFGDFELGRIRQTTTTVSTLPTLTQRQAAGIDVSKLDPVALQILSYIPLPQTNANTKNYVYASPDIEDPHRWDFRIDQIVSEKQNIYFRYSSQVNDIGVTSPLPPDANGNYYSGSGNNYTTSKSFVLVHNAIWTPTIVTSVHVGWNSLIWTNTFPPQNLTSVGIPGVSQSNPGFSQINITGMQAFGVTNVPNSDGSQDRQLSGDLTWTKGAHTLKFGVQAYWLQTNFFSSQRSSGIFNFTGQFTGDPFQDFLLGEAYSTSVSKYAFLQFRAPYTHFYTQDDWRVTRHLTLNIGLRYELSPPAVEKNNKIANFDLGSNPGSPQLVLPTNDNRSSRALQGVNYHQFAPRFGFAYSLDDKTVLRGGYGIFYSNLITLGGMQSLEINPPNTIRVSITDNTTTPTVFLSRGYAANALDFSSARNVTLVSYDRENLTPLSQEWNFNIQRQLPGGIVFEAGYYGNKLDHMWRQIDGNPASPGPGALNSRRRYRSTLVPGTSDLITLADVVRIQKDGYSRYNALQVKAEKRYSRGVTFIASYAYSKTMALGDTAGVQNPANWAADRAVSIQDMTHHFVGSSIYELPFGHGKNLGHDWNRFTDALLGGWSVGPILTLSSGLPLSLTEVTDPSNTGQVDRPNVVADWRLSHPTVQEWFNVNAFVPATSGFGSAGRNIFRGPGLFNLDLAAHKTFRVSERITAQLRLESFNVTNTPALGAPNTQVGNPLFGQISSAGTPRDNQIGLKILF